MANPQPAKKGYFFEQGFIDIRNVVKTTFAQIRDTIDEHKEELDSASKWAMSFHISVIVSVWVFGGAVSLLISALHSIVNFTIMLFYYVLFFIVLLIDRTYLLIKKISISCRVCKAQYMYPIYVCPNCEAKHDRLTPSIYGAFRRTCNCGYRLPTSILNFTDKRADLRAYCPECARAGYEEELSIGESMSRPFCVPVIGGPSVGKSAFITAYANLFVDTISLDKDIEVDFYNLDIEDDFAEKKKFFRYGQIMKTAVQTDLHLASSIAFSFFINHPSLNPARLVHIYDIAGESFLNGANETQKQYDYCDGFVLVLDPFSIPEVMSRFGHQLNSTDLGGTSAEHIDSMMENFILTLENTTKLSKNKILSTPLAVVLNKVDEAALDLIIGDAAVARARASYPSIFTNDFDTMDFLCREFLRKVDMEDVLAHIQQNFKNTRFFATSAIGHTLNLGRYNPHNVVEVFDWIFSNSADKELASVVTSTRFSNNKLPIKAGVELIDFEEVVI